MHALVIGDVMLDHYIGTDPVKISDEAPVLVTRKAEEEFILGGAANVAANIVSLGHKVSLVANVGADPAGDILCRLCRTAGINTVGVVPVAMPTIEKMRVECRKTQVVRVDTEEFYLAHYTDQQLSTPDVDLVVLSDYAKGGVHAGVVQAVRQQFPSVPIIANIKPKNIHGYKGIDMVTMNHREWQDVSNGVSGSAVRDMLQVNYLVVTEGAIGIQGYSDEEIYFSKGFSLCPVDITGAGDVVVATLAVCKMEGIPFKTAIDFANRAGACKVLKRHTAIVTREEVGL